MLHDDHMGREILDGLCDPGRVLIFVDDSGTPGKPLSNLARDYILMCGVCMESEKYRILKPDLQAVLDNLGTDEFHAKHMMRPNSKSTWKKICPPERRRIISLLIDAIEEGVETILFCYVSGEQYYSDMEPRIKAKGIEMKHKAALHHVFFKCVIDRWYPTVQPWLRNREMAVVFDSPKPIGKEQIALQRIRNPQGFYQGSLIHVDSRVEIGIQLADFAAYTINRYFHSEQRRIEGKSDAFDEVFTDAANRIMPKVVQLLDIEG